MADQRTDCRDLVNKDHSKYINCVEQGIYDPCDDAGGTFGKAQCAWAYNEIAERKITAAEEEIKARIGNDDKRHKALAQFLVSEDQWHKYRNSYCNFTNKAEDFTEFDSTSNFDLGFCKRRLAEQHAGELQMILQRDEDGNQ